jgi:hypothetical protein
MTETVEDKTFKQVITDWLEGKIFKIKNLMHKIRLI